MERRIETNKKNYTRFLILTDNKDLVIDDANKASISFQVADEPGSLVKVLNVFAEHNINMSKVQSMPVLGKRNQYNFYIDLEFPSKADYEEAVRKVLRYTINFAIMGEYRKNDEV
jgi:prephenate dehydratase